MIEIRHVIQIIQMIHLLRSIEITVIIEIRHIIQAIDTHLLDCQNDLLAPLQNSEFCHCEYYSMRSRHKVLGGRWDGDALKL